MTVVLPFRGELGLKIRFHVPAVHAIEGEHTVCIETGEEALYPSASEWVTVPRNDDAKRRDQYSKDAEFLAELRQRMGAGPYVMPQRGWPEERFVPEPHVRQGIECDIVICPRRREYGAEKNWPSWDVVAELPGVFAAGAPDSSYDVNCERAWDYERFLDASIEAIRSARLVVATDAGLAHLAVLCGAPLLMITDCGRVAPGPVRNGEGHVVHDQYWPVRMDEYYHAANHTGSPLHVSEHWWSPDRLLEEVDALLAERAVL